MPGELPEGPVTILFTDVEGSTDLRTRLGDAAAHRLLRQAETIVRAKLEDYGGVEVKAMGDGHMVWFASPRKAVACAAAIQRALDGHAVRIRMGLNTGEVTPEGGDLYGEAVNGAARVAAKAGGGEILVSEVVRQLTGTLADTPYVEKGRVRLKGFPDRWRLFAVDWRHAVVPEPPAQSNEFAMVGREKELAGLCEVVESAVGGHGRTAIVEGEAGIGKSRLVAEACALARRRGATVLQGRADDLGRDRPLGAFVDALGLVPHTSDPRRRDLAEGRTRPEHLALLPPLLFPRRHRRPPRQGRPPAWPSIFRSLSARTSSLSSAVRCGRLHPATCRERRRAPRPGLSAATTNPKVPESDRMRRGVPRPRSAWSGRGRRRGRLNRCADVQRHRH